MFNFSDVDCCDPMPILSNLTHGMEFNWGSSDSDSDTEDTTNSRKRKRVSKKLNLFILFSVMQNIELSELKRLYIAYVFIRYDVFVSSRKVEIIPHLKFCTCRNKKYMYVCSNSFIKSTCVNNIVYSKQHAVL